MSIRRYTLLAAALILLSAAVQLGPVDVHGANGYDGRAPELQSILDRELPGLMKKYGVPGVEITVIDEDRISTMSYGYAEVSTQKPVTADTMFQVGSLSKTVTAWGAMKLVDQGKIALDEPIEKYLKTWPLPESKYSSEGVTLRRILSHTAGLSLRGYAGVKPSEGLVPLEESLRGNTKGAGDVRIINEPGSIFQYSGGGYTLLQLVIEEVSGMPFAQYMDQEILKPLGMNNSTFEWGEAAPRTSKAYGVLGQELPNYIFTEKAAAGFYTTSADLAKLQAAAMDLPGSMPAGGGVLKPETVALMKQGVLNNAWGLGYELMELPKGETAIGHGGANRGWRARMLQMTDKNQGLVVLTNSDTGSNILVEVAALWIQQQTGALPDFYKAMHNNERLALIIAGAMALLLAIVSVCVAKSIIVKSRQYSYFISKNKWRRLLRVLLPMLAVAAWWIGLYAPIIQGWNAAQFLPVNVKWITFVLTLWCIPLLAIALFPQKNIKLPGNNIGMKKENL
ncbi:MAG TPA: serine hydrolase domain-containing protein [Clostridia bacterium]|nr:serine hydrolase domain-containing protein [Clostridia bacterium]